LAGPCGPAGWACDRGVTHANARSIQTGDAEKDGFQPLAPDFVVQLRSTSDGLETIQAKMNEYRENGLRLGWLLNPDARQVFVCGPGQRVDVLDNLESISGDPERPGSLLEQRPIWDPGF
jgi:Uma2 family endonuclease